MRTFPAFFEKITAVFAVSEHYALEFMRFLQGQSIRVPEDVQTIGFDDTLASRESVPALTTIHQDAALRARTAILRVGAGLGVWGVVNLLEGYGSDNPGSNAHVR